MAAQKRKRIRESLLLQLAIKGASAEHYIDLINDYMNLWDAKNALIKDIKKRGVTYQDNSSTGVLVWKDNPAVKDLLATNRQMLSILKELNLSTKEVDGGDADEL